MRALLIAEAANPEWTSVPLVGYNIARAIAKKTDALLVTQVRNRAALLRSGLIEGKEFVAIDNEAVAARLHRLSAALQGDPGKAWTISTAFSTLAYYSFEREVWRQFGRRIADKEFDVVHRITPLSPTSPSLMANRLAQVGVHFVVGPLNGGIPWPKGFGDRRIAEREWLSYVRAGFKLLPGYRSTRRYASAILVGSQHTYDEMPRSARGKCFVVPENGYDPAYFGGARREPVLPLRAAFVGRLVPYKGADILLRAAAGFLKSGSLTIDIIGDGPQRAELGTLIAELGVENFVKFHGIVPNKQVAKVLGKCDFLAFPSIREFGGGVVVEAMALGMPAMVANYGGPAELVDERTGIRVPFTDQASLIEGFKRSIAAVIQTPAILGKLGQAAQKRAFDQLTWDAKADQILCIYRSVIA